MNKLTGQLLTGITTYSLFFVFVLLVSFVVCLLVFEHVCASCASGVDGQPTEERKKHDSDAKVGVTSAPICHCHVWKVCAALWWVFVRMFLERSTGNSGRNSPKLRITQSRINRFMKNILVLERSLCRSSSCVCYLSCFHDNSGGHCLLLRGDSDPSCSRTDGY